MNGDLRFQSSICSCNHVAAGKRLSETREWRTKERARPIVEVNWLSLRRPQFARIHSTRFTIKNNCPYGIAPATLTGTGDSVSTGFELAPQVSNTITMPVPWSGRVWARFGCSNNGGKFHCNSGDCGSGQVGCNGAGAAPPATLVEFTLSPAGQNDFYDVSLVDGFNLPVLVVPQGGARCPTTDCPVDINAQCPQELAVKDASGGTIGCKSACLQFNKPEYCCTGNYNRPETCPPTNYSRFFKNLCPKAYSYAYDDTSSTFTCGNGADYLITFCP
ncbi:Thaumatin [Cynara cardunculus var. scolymus]|uniref:Thaumatin n=1 Tax=Cynara cardunculus var. scolymus TaxID=59895 RepID=A0A124SH15_CYNCS|nr:Thaumatin [Cynara cardunculus var. scolymus]